MLKVGPPDGWRIAPVTRLPMAPSPSTSPIVVVVLPSPSVVGVMAVTSTYLPSGACASRSRMRAWSTLPTWWPYGSTSCGSSPSSPASCCTLFMSRSAASLICQSAIVTGSRVVIAPVP